MPLRSLRNPVIWGLPILIGLPFLYRSPDGLNGYLLNRWGAAYTVFLFGWCLAGAICIHWRLTGNLRGSLAKFGAAILGSYAALVLISSVMWHQKRSSYVTGVGHPTPFWVRDSELMIRNRPNFHWKGVGASPSLAPEEERVVSVDLDGEGFRNPSESPSELDVAFVGDSFTFGGQVDHQELFSSILGRQLHLRVRNYGVPGVGQGTELAVLNKYVFQRKPRVVVLQIFDNDPTDDLKYLVWKSNGPSRVDTENWILGRWNLDRDHPLVGIFTLQLPLQLIRESLFRTSDRCGGFLVQLRDRVVHFNVGMPLQIDCDWNPSFLQLPVDFAREIDSYPGSVFDAKATAEWVERACRSFFSNWPKSEKEEFLNHVTSECAKYLIMREFIDSIATSCRENGCKLLVIRIASAWLTYREIMRPVPGSSPSFTEFPSLKLPGLHSMDMLLARRIRPKEGAYLSTLDLWKNPEDFYYFRYDCHLNPTGHRALATALTPEIAKLIKSARNGNPANLH